MSERLREEAHKLAMLVLQSDFYSAPEVKESVDNILAIYGEGEEEPCYICHKVGGHEPFCSRVSQKGEELHNCKDTPKRVGNDIYCDSCGKLLVEYSNVEQDQPSPIPTRAEWEAWFDDMPSGPNCFDTDTKWRDQMIDWYHSMPCVPKEETK